MLKRVESGQLEIAYEESGSIEGNPIAAAHGSSFIKSAAGRASLRALDVLEGNVSSRRSSVKGHHSIVRAPNHFDNIH